MGEGRKVQSEIHPCDQQEDHRDEVDGRAVEVAHAGIVGRESTDRHGGEGVADGIEQRHSCGPECQGTDSGDEQIDVPERLGRLGNARGHLVVLDWPRDLGTVELHAPDTEQRQYGDRQHDDPHASQPLQQLAIEQERLGQLIEPGQHGCSRGRQPGKGFEEGL